MSRLDLFATRPSNRLAAAAAFTSSHAQKTSSDEPGFIVYPEIDERRDVRFVPPQCAVVLTLANGEKRDARITNVSRHSISVLADFTQIPMNQVTKIGKSMVTPVRRFPGGAAFNFIAPLPMKISASDFTA